MFPNLQTIEERKWNVYPLDSDTLSSFYSTGSKESRNPGLDPILRTQVRVWDLEDDGRSRGDPSTQRNETNLKIVMWNSTGNVVCRVARNLGVWSFWLLSLRRTETLGVWRKDGVVGFTEVVWVPPGLGGKTNRRLDTNIKILTTRYSFSFIRSTFY